ncbi:MAG: hypothetical protein IJ177_10205 [Fibrobacter sp.]|uniref:hypothetical protein n=1 Tax=Fibrobacter sp. TaxID=35828 RepID=UPI0025B8D73C|nr:hypothetical protein [Fibrobacter sp.]MBQ9226539.1 hypothetical protein [Fibrobacter sp.]
MPNSDKYSDKFTCWINFWRYDEKGNRIGFPRKEKLRLEVTGLKVEEGLTNHSAATLYFADGTHVGPFKYSKWYPSSRVACIASNYSKWLYRKGRAEK